MEKIKANIEITIPNNGIYCEKEESEYIGSCQFLHGHSCILFDDDLIMGRGLKLKRCKKCLKTFKIKKMTNSKKMEKYIEETRKYILSLSKEEIDKEIKLMNNDIGELILEAGFLDKENLKDGEVKI